MIDGKTLNYFRIDFRSRNSMNRGTNSTMQMLQPQFVQVEVADVDQPYIVYAD